MYVAVQKKLMAQNYRNSVGNWGFCVIMEQGTKELFSSEDLSDTHQMEVELCCCTPWIWHVIRLEDLFPSALSADIPPRIHSFAGEPLRAFHRGSVRGREFRDVSLDIFSFREPAWCSG